MKILGILLSLLCLSNTQVLAQNRSVRSGTEQISMDTVYYFDNENYEKDVFIDVTEGLGKFTVEINGQLFFGRVTATLYDPNGKREGGFILQGDDNNKAQSITANGNLLIPKFYPLRGKWILKIMTKKAKGQLEIIVY